MVENSSDKWQLSRRRLLSGCATAGLLTSTTTSTSASIPTEHQRISMFPTTNSISNTDRHDDIDQQTAGGQSGTPVTVTFSTQTSNGKTVTIDSVTIPEDGFVAVHDTRLKQNKPIKSVIGVSEYLPSGHHETINVELFKVSGATYDRSKLVDDQRLIVMPHEDTDTNRQFEFVASNGTQDPAYTVSGDPVTDSACITVTDNDC